MKSIHPVKHLHVLLIEDNPGDVRLMKEALRENKAPMNLSVVHDGVEALAYLRHEAPYEAVALPDFILLDLNLPRKHGSQILVEIKTSAAWRHIPVIVLSSSRQEEDVRRSYDLQANCYITKPVDLDHFVSMVRNVGEFWVKTAHLPSMLEPLS